MRSGVAIRDGAGLTIAALGAFERFIETRPLVSAAGIDVTD
jgi:hypothetical protein